MALDFKYCSQSYNLKQSLKASGDGSSLAYSSGLQNYICHTIHRRKC